MPGVNVLEVRLHFSCSKMSDRLLYQSDSEQLVLERGLVVMEPEVHFAVFLRGLWNPGYENVDLAYSEHEETEMLAVYAYADELGFEPGLNSPELLCMLF